MLLLSTAYFAPIRYYAELLRGEQAVMERYECYSRRTYRNRCTVFAANGLIDLVVPVVKTAQRKVMIAEVEIAYGTLWQKQHFKTIESAYRRSPFYEHYIDDLLFPFNVRHRYLYEMNMQILRKLCSIMKIPCRIDESERFIKKPADGIVDLRDSLHPKHRGQNACCTFVAPRYTQVFAGRWGFKPNLSVLDLLFNAGPEAGTLLAESLQSV